MHSDIFFVAGVTCDDIYDMGNAAISVLSPKMVYGSNMAEEEFEKCIPRFGEVIDIDEDLRDIILERVKTIQVKY